MTTNIRKTNQRLFIYLRGTLILWATLQRRARGLKDAIKNS